MTIFVPVLALSAAFSTGAPFQGTSAVAPRAGADLEARPVRPQAEARPAPTRAQLPATAACLGDFCQPVVAVPGYDTEQFVHVSRTELFADFLARSHIEPLASIIGMFAATGLRVDYEPGFVAGAGSGHAKWGSLQVRLKWRLDPWNEPVFHRPSASSSSRPQR